LRATPQFDHGFSLAVSVFKVLPLYLSTMLAVVGTPRRTKIAGGPSLHLFLLWVSGVVRIEHCRLHFGICRRGKVIISY
jgi:hypothetical protein